MNDDAKVFKAIHAKEDLQEPLPVEVFSTRVEAIIM